MIVQPVSLGVIYRLPELSGQWQCYTCPNSPWPWKHTRLRAARKDRKRTYKAVPFTSRQRVPCHCQGRPTLRQEILYPPRVRQVLICSAMGFLQGTQTGTYSFKIIPTIYSLPHEPPPSPKTVESPGPRLARWLPHILAIPMHWRYPSSSGYQVCTSGGLT